MPAIETTSVDHGEQPQRDRQRLASTRGEDDLVAPLKAVRLLEARWVPGSTSSPGCKSTMQRAAA